MNKTKAWRTGQLALAGAVLLVAAAVAQGKKQMDAQTLAVGAAAPAYSLPDQNGTQHTSAQDKGKVVLLAFYPADFTGGCTLEAHSLSKASKDLQNLGVTVYGVSVQDSKSHKAFCDKEGISYTLLADTDKNAARNFGVLLPFRGGIANRVTYIVGKDGNIVYVDKDVNSHIPTAGADYVAWLQKHPEVTENGKAAELPPAPKVVVKAANTESAEADQTPASKVATLGKKAPAIALPDVTTGKMMTLADASKGKKATVVMFIATQCPVSNAYNERMEMLAKSYAAKGVAFVGVNANAQESVAECAAHAKAHGFTFPVLKDAGNKVADAYDARVTPETFVLDGTGKLVYHGRIDNSQDPSGVTTRDLSTALDSVLAGHPVARAETKAFGCAVKRAN